VGAASGLPDTPHYKNLKTGQSGLKIKLFTFEVNLNCSSSEFMLQNFSEQTIVGLEQGDHASLVSDMAANDPSPCTPGLGLGIEWC
jgi:hypothetical protein